MPFLDSELLFDQHGLDGTHQIQYPLQSMRLFGNMIIQPSERRIDPRISGVRGHNIRATAPTTGSGEDGEESREAVENTVFALEHHLIEPKTGFLHKRLSMGKYRSME